MVEATYEALESGDEITMKDAWRNFHTEQPNENTVSRKCVQSWTKLDFPHPIQFPTDPDSFYNLKD